MVAVLLCGSGQAGELDPPAVTELRGILEDLETFSRRMEAIASRDPREARRSTLRLLKSFEERLPRLRRRASEALSRLEARVEHESSRVDRDERRAAAAAKRLEELRRSLRVQTTGKATRPSTVREKRVRALTSRLVEGLLREKEHQAAATLVTLGERSRRSRELDEELVESSARLDSLFRRLESALPRAVSLLESSPPPPTVPASLGPAPRRLVLALDRIQRALLDVMAAHVVTLEAMSAGPKDRDKPPTQETPKGRNRS